MLGTQSRNFKIEAILSEPKIIAIDEVRRPSGYVIPGYRNYHVVVEDQNVRADGWGTGQSSEAIAKAKSEAIERHTFLLASIYDGEVSTSNGWSAHMTDFEARDAAVSELIERDSALSAWFNIGPYLSVPQSLWPSELIRWSDNTSKSSVEFGNIQVLLSVGNNGCCATVILKATSGSGVTGHASGYDLQKAILSAFFEALRSAHAALRFDDLADVIALHESKATEKIFGPGANALAYAYGEPIPTIDVIASTESEILNQWRTHQLQLSKHLEAATINYFNVGDRVVAHATLENVLKIFWGKTPEDFNVKNKRPHIVG